MSEIETQAPQPNRKAKSRKKLKVGGAVVVMLIVIGIVSSHNKSDSNSASSPAASDVQAAPVVAQKSPSTPVTGKIAGHFQSTATCFGCGDMVKYIHVDRVWCAWQGDNVIVHARFANSSVEHVTVNWHPSYTIAGGGSHGTGLTSVQSSGLDAHATRGIYVKQQPKGVPPGSPLSLCDPAFQEVQSG